MEETKERPNDCATYVIGHYYLQVCNTEDGSMKGHLQIVLLQWWATSAREGGMHQPKQAKIK